MTTSPHPCIVPGCRREGRNKLGVRCRVWHDGPYSHGKGKTGALWAPDADAFLWGKRVVGATGGGTPPFRGQVQSAPGSYYIAQERDRSHQYGGRDVTGPARKRQLVLPLAR